MATLQQLADCIRMYQRANTREAMAAADAVADRLVGSPRDAADKPAAPVRTRKPRK